MTNTDLDAKFARIVAIARRVSGMTAAEFDYDLSHDGDRAARALGNATYDVATAGLPPVEPGDDAALRARWEANDRLLAATRPHRDQMTAAAKGKSYVGWSSASRGPIRYAS